MYRSGQTVLVFSKTEVETFEMIRRIAMMYSLPQWIRNQHPVANQSDKGINLKNHSRIMGLMSTKSRLTSFTGSLVIMDEAAFMADPTSFYAAMKPLNRHGGPVNNNLNLR